MYHLLLMMWSILLSKRSFVDNYRFSSHKFNISSSDWTNDIAILLTKLEMKFYSK